MCSDMGNIPLCISHQEGTVLGDYSDHHADYMIVPRPSRRYLSESHDMHARLAEGGAGERRGRGGEEEEEGVWGGLCSEGVEGERWEEGECDMILGLELLQDSVSACSAGVLCTCTYCSPHVQKHS